MLVAPVYEPEPEPNVGTQANNLATAAVSYPYFPKVVFGECCRSYSAWSYKNPGRTGIKTLLSPGHLYFNRLSRQACLNPYHTVR